MNSSTHTSSNTLKRSSKPLFAIFFTFFSLILLLDTALITGFFKVQFGWDFEMFFLVWIVFWGISFAYVFGEMLSRWTGFFGLKWIGALILGWLSIITSCVAIGAIPLVLGVREPILGIIVFGSSIGLTVWGIVNEWRTQSISSFRVFVDGDQISDIQPEPIQQDDGAALRLVHLTDIHLNGLKSVKWTQKLVDKVNGLDPDIIVFTGDFLDTNRDNVVGQIETLNCLKSTYKLAVSGNHDFYSNYAVYESVLSDMGFECMDGRVQDLDVNGFALQVVGMPDKDHSRFGVPGIKLSELLSSADPKKGLLMLLRHRPEEVEASIELGVDLQLSGHTHGGQLPPWGILVRMAFRFCNGLYEVGKGYIYTSKGTGTWGPPVRLFKRSEIAVFDFFK